MYAIIQTGGKQYRVTEGEVIFVEKLEADIDSEFTFDKVLALSNDSGLNVGAPYVDGATVTGKVLSQGKDKKIIIFKYKAKKGYRNKTGHRQPYTKVQIEKING